jgi:probable F420-dependent oxidoreductase
MRLGLWLPIVNLNPAYRAAAWERDGDIDDIVAVAAAADALGYDCLCAPEHVALPAARKAVRGERYWEPMSTLGYVAAHTRRIKLVPLVLVLGYHHPLAIAKSIATLDRISKGRAILGVGVGSLEEEFSLLDAAFTNRGMRADDSLRAIRAALGERTPSYRGPYFDFSGMTVDPWPRVDLPIWVGGKTRRSLRRALEFGDAWTPVDLTVEQLGAILAEPWAKDGLAARKCKLTIAQVAGGTQSTTLDPLGDPAGAASYLRTAARAGAELLIPYLTSRTRDHYIEQMEALMRLQAKSS